MSMPSLELDGFVNDVYRQIIFWFNGFVPMIYQHTNSMTLLFDASKYSIAI